MDQHVPAASAIDPELCLFIAGVFVSPSNIDTDRIEFELPLPSAPVWLRSRSDRPARTGLSDDNRLLGFSVWSITVSDGRTTRQFGPPELAGHEGFYEPELPRHIWTNGQALLPSKMFEGLAGPVTLCVEGNGLPSYTTQSDAALRAQEVMRSVLSLGENCDVGFAQEYYDAEPLDLLRWANARFDQLLAGLRCGFSGLGSTAETELVWVDSEYRLIDRRYASFHTMAFAPLDAEAQAALAQTGVRRLQFLRRKLLHDLAEGRRLLVYRTRQRGFVRQDACDLLEAVRACGAAPLLVLTPARAPEEAGVVTVLGDGLFLGGFDPDVSGADTFGATMRLCQVAHMLAG
jgi:hypothetical protein